MPKLSVDVGRTCPDLDLRWGARGNGALRQVAVTGIAGVGRTRVLAWREAGS